MTHRVRSAFGRFLALVMIGLAVSLVFDRTSNGQPPDAKRVVAATAALGVLWALVLRVTRASVMQTGKQGEPFELLAAKMSPSVRLPPKRPCLAQFLRRFLEKFHTRVPPDGALASGSPHGVYYPLVQ